MGKRGPAPTPTALRILAGETRPSQINYEEPKPRAGWPTMPADLDDEAQRAWRRVRRAIGKTGIVTSADGDLLRAYCEAFSRYVEAQRLYVKTGPLTRGARSGELVKNPLHQVVRDNALIVRALGREFGLTPSGRVMLRTKGADPMADDPVEEFLRGHRSA